MGDTLANGLQDLDIEDRVETVNPNRCLLLGLLPAELRVEIYELALRQDPPVIVIDLRESPNHTSQDHANPPYALTLTNKQIHHETSQIRYRINAVHIHAPIFNPDPSIYPDKRGRIIERLQRAATQQVRTQQLTSVKIFLGRMVPIGRLRWIDFFSQWNAAIPALTVLRDGVAGLEVEFQTTLSRERKVRFRFDVKTREGVEKGLQRAVGMEGDEAEMMGSEEYRLGRIRKTIVKTLFEEGEV